MELYCSESSSLDGCPRGDTDTAILDHSSTLSNMLELQKKSLIKKHGDGKSKLEPAARKLVATWMLEVCEEQNCEDQVFLVAVYLLDSFLTCVNVRKTQLQLAATVCLLLASKLRQCNFLSVDLLAYYSDNSITREEITHWELLLVAKLGWDLCPVTPVDFVDSLLRRLNVPVEHVIRRHALTFVALAATEPEFVGTKSSLVASAAIVSAIQGICPEQGLPAAQVLARSLKATVPEIQQVLDRLEETVERASKEQGPVSDDSSYHGNDSNNNSLGGDSSDSIPSNKQLSRQMHVDPNYICYSPMEQDTMNDSYEDSSTATEDHEGYDTPTDITDINFSE